MFVDTDVGAVNPNDVADALKLRELVLIMREESHRDTAIRLLACIQRLVRLVMHGGVDDLEQLSVECFFGVRATCIDHNPVQIVELRVPERRVRQSGIHMMSLRLLVG